jgi:hypothetical protein
MSYNPLTVSDQTAAQILLFVRRYVAKHSQPECQYPLSPDAREEVTAQIVYDWQTADYEEWTPDNDQHAAASHARKWRMRGWHGNTADAQAERRFSAKLAKQRVAEGWTDTPSSGTSEDSRTPTPLALLMAREESDRNGLRYVSDRQRKARRKAVRGRNRLERLLIVDGRYETHTAIRFEVVKVHGVSHKGHTPNRQIGKSKTVRVPADVAAWALQGRDTHGRFTRSTIPVPVLWTEETRQYLTTPAAPVGKPETVADVAEYREALAAHYNTDRPLVAGDPRRVRIVARWKLRQLVNASR